MIPLAWDTETALIRPAQLAPPLVCLTWQTPQSPPRIVHHANARTHIEQWLKNPQLELIGAHVAYDFAVVCAKWPDLVPAVFAAYDADRVTDVQIRQKLLDIAAGVYRGRVGAKGVWITHKYDLDSLSKRVAGVALQKDAWRLSYGEFIDVPLEQWPTHARVVQERAKVRAAELERQLSAGEVDAKDGGKELEGLRSMIASDPGQCVKYPLDDAAATLAVYIPQERHRKYLDDQYRQARGAFWLYLSSTWGIRTDAEGVDVLRRETTAALAEVQDELVQLGLVRANGQRDTKEAKRKMLEVCAREGLTLRRTEGHVKKGPAEGKCKKLDGTLVAFGSDECEDHVCLDAEACAATEDDTLIDYAEFSTLKKVLSNDVEALAKGICWPVHTRYDLAETGRTTSSKPNLQNLRKRPGIREAFVPRPGHVFYQADFPALEMYTWAQCCISWFGFSKLAELLNAGLDPHLAMAATILGITYEEAAARHATKDAEVDDVRQVCKPANFGFPGGMGAKKFLSSVCKQLRQIMGTDVGNAFIARMGIDLAFVERLREGWKETWPEHVPHFARMQALTSNPGGTASVETLFTKRWRGGAGYCAVGNNGFQGLGVDIAKEAGWRIARAQYVERASPLFGARTVAFVHDELIGECLDDARAHDVAYAQAQHMADAAAMYLPDVPIPVKKIKPLLMRRWSKKAQPTFGADGRLIPWG